METPAEVALLFTDIEASTRLWEADATAMSQALALHDEVVGDAVVEHGGHVFKTVGDGFCVAFDDPAAAVHAAVAMQQALVSTVWPTGTPIRVRAGIHVGVCERRAGDYFGSAVNRVARLHAVAHGGQIIVSGRTAELVKGSVSTTIELLDLGEHRLKDLERSERVFQVRAPRLERAFPPLRSLTHPKLQHNLPEQHSTFIGREQELKDLQELLAKARVVTLVGAGGVGKTRLALHVCAELIDGSGDGVWFVDLAPLVDETLVAATVARVLGVPESPGHSVLDTLVDALRDRTTLLLFDNCEHVIDAAAAVVSALTRECPRVAVLATSRAPLRVHAERTYRVPSLAMSDANAPADELAQSPAVRFFQQRALEQGTPLADERSDMIGFICRRLDGIPLALELAASRLRALDISELAARLDRRFQLLKYPERDRLPRQQTLHALIDWSYQLLAPAERALLCAASVFRGTFDLAAADAVSAPGDSVLDLIEALVDKSLIQVEPGRRATRYRLLESIREFAAEALGEDRHRAICDVHADHYLALAEPAAPHLIAHGQLEAVARLDIEQDNVRAALAHTFHDSDPARPARLLIALRHYWRLRQAISEGTRWVERMLGHRGIGAKPVLRGQVLAAGAHLEFERNPAAAIALGEEALAIAREYGDRAMEADVLRSIGQAQRFMGQLDEARESLDAGLALARDQADRQLAACCLLGRGSVQADSGRDGAAEAEEALTLFSGVGDRMGAAVAADNLGYMRLISGRFAEARVTLENASPSCAILASPKDS